MPRLQIEWRRDQEDPETENLFVQEAYVGWIGPRPQYCDRGHWAVEVELPDIDKARWLSRYYMKYETAKAETEAFLRWRILKERAEPRESNA
jgi:hypothetical protein